ncbi:TAXI family TRAP transporter solute-binding subunit [Methylobacterium sp. J-048]|uniref:TAXI family TRAP transporter solute-binding subunit n=1 Tax=Methylobacterium sp. J-048 TaxID=2836635 RepID=UPI001FB97596|nr:TAXI family TRAP transporter solute-binding subunit [Methylobacterium sp. J-048]MCJ2057330.1 TAXI family TRAP transporter solute-binding subunit [Methylobacterium sp. J-048]
MKRRLTGAEWPSRRTALLSGLGVVLARPVLAAEPVRVVLATATPGGGFPAFGDAFAASIHAADPELVIESRASSGSAENVGLLRAGRVDLALVQGEYAYPALTESIDLKVLAPMYPTSGLFAVPAASPIRTVEDLRGRSVVLGTHSSGLTVMGRAALQASGLDPEHDIRPILLDRAGDGPRMVRDGGADALWGGGLGWPGFVAMAQEPGGARFFGPSEAGIARIAHAGAALQRMTVPAGSFAGQMSAIETVGSWSLVLARPGFEAATAYRIVQALAHADMAARHPQGAATQPRNLRGIVPTAQLNLGTLRYLEETGVTAP